MCFSVPFWPPCQGMVQHRDRKDRSVRISNTFYTVKVKLHTWLWHILARMLMCFTLLVPWTAILVPLLWLAEKHTEKFKFWGVSSHPFNPFLFQLTLYQENILSVVGIKVWENQTDIHAITVFISLLKLRVVT